MKKFLSLALFTAMILTLLAFPTSAAWDGTSASASLKGEGTQASPYLVETAEDLAFLASSVNGGNSYEGKYIVQTADIDLGGKAWTAIGTKEAPFSGVYSGLGNKIAGFSITGAPETNVGLFGYVVPGAVDAGIANLTVEGAIALDGITASNFGIGAIAGFAGIDGETVKTQVIIANCTANVEITLTNCSGEPRVGGITGYIFCGKVENCVSNGNISASGTNHTRAGGITGQTNRTHFLNCTNNGNITSDVAAAKNSRAAGIAAVTTRGGAQGDEENAVYTVYENCINNGVILAKGQTTIFAAGIGADFYVAGTWPNKDCRVKFINCINNGAITAETTNSGVYPHAGGIGGYTGNGYTEYEFYGCINTGEIKSLGGKQDRAGGIVGTVYSGSATYIFDKCIATGNLKSGTFSLANKADALATSIENADAATVAAAVDTIEKLMVKSETAIAGFDASKGAPEPEITEPPVTEPPVTEPPVSGETGDPAVVFIVIALISICGVAMIAKRREN